MPGARRWRTRCEWLVPACAIASVVPLYCARHLPMADLPEHIATIATLRHYWDPAWRSMEYFSLAGAWETQYWLYDVVGALVAVVLGSAERANLFLLTLGGLGYTYGLSALLRALGRDARLAVMGGPLFWGLSLTVGLVNYVVSVPVVLFALAMVARQAHRPTRRRDVVLSILAMAIFYLHASSFVVLVLAALALTALLPRPRGLGVAVAACLRWSLHLSRRMVWLLPCVVSALVVACARVARGDHESADIGFQSKGFLLRNLPVWLFDLWRDRIDDVLGWTAIAVVALVWLTQRRVDAPLATRRRRAAGALFLLAVALYFFFPGRIGVYAFLLDLRLAVYVGAFAIPMLRPRAGLLGTIPVAALAATSMGLSIHTATQVRAFEVDEVGHFDDLLRAMPTGSRLVMLNFQRQSIHSNVDPFAYFGSYYRARYGGISAFSFSEVPHWPVRYRPRWKPPMPLTWGDACGYRNSRDGEFFEMVLTHGEHVPFASVSGPGPTWELVGATRAWRLYRKVPGVRNASPVEEDLGPCAADRDAVSTR